MKLKLTMLVCLLSLGLASAVQAGSVADTDGDTVPDAFDNCSGTANGPGEAPSNQVDTDTDGYGNICDGDFDNTNPTVDLDDFNLFLGDFGNPATSQFDMDADGDTDLDDFNAFLAVFGGPPGPSGLPCAGTVPCS